MLEESGSKDLRFDVSGGSGGGGNKLNKLEDVKVRLRIVNTLNGKHDIKEFKP